MKQLHIIIDFFKSLKQPSKKIKNIIGNILETDQEHKILQEDKKSNEKNCEKYYLIVKQPKLIQPEL
jgi:hypothetical protein